MQQIELENARFIVEAYTSNKLDQSVYDDEVGELFERTQWALTLDQLVDLEREANQITDRLKDSSAASGPKRILTRAAVECALEIALERLC